MYRCSFMDFDASEEVIFWILMQVDRSDWRRKYIINTLLENMDTILVGGLIPGGLNYIERKYKDPKQTVNFTGCISGTLRSMIFFLGG